MNEMDESSETLWRSIDSSLGMFDTLSADASFKSLEGADDSKLTSAISTPKKSASHIGDDLLDALRNLQIASMKKPAKFRPLMNSNAVQEPHSGLQSEILQPVTLSPQCEEDPQIRAVLEDLLQQVASADESVTCPSQMEHLDEIAEPLIPAPEPEKPENTTSTPESDLSKANKSVSNPDQTAEAISNEINSIPVAPEILDNMKKAVKPMLKAPTVTKKFTKGVSPILQTKSRSRPTEPSIHLNQSTRNNLGKKVEEVKTLSSLKRQSTKNVVTTVVSTKEGIKLMEEKITNFGIPVNPERKKKRTQPIPFSFDRRVKSSLGQSQVQRKIGEKLPMRESNSGNHQQPVIKSITKDTLKLQSRIQPVGKSFLSNDAMDKENRSIGLNKSRTLGGPKSTENRLHERREFEEKAKQRAKEIGKMRAQIDLKKSKGPNVDVELKNKMEIKKPIPVFKIPAPVKASKLGTVKSGK